MLSENALIVNRYRLIKLLGRGGFSEVWLAIDNFTSVKVALKIYAPGFGLDNEGIKLFSQEFSLVFDLNHSNLLRPSHYDHFERMPFLVLPYCEQGSTLKMAGSMSEEEAWFFLRDVSGGLAFLHSQKTPVIHQDIKPDNILVDSENNYMITDFGISTRIRSTLRKSIDKPVGQSGGGTLAYMGPERFGSDPQPIMASDIWSLGATMYELLTGEAPFGEHGGLLQKNGSDIPQIKGVYSKELKNLIYKCLSQEPWDRPTGATIYEYAQKTINGEKISISSAKFVGVSKNRKKIFIYGTIGFAVVASIVSFIMLRPVPYSAPDLYPQYVPLVQKGDSLASNAYKQGKDYELDLAAAQEVYLKAKDLLPQLDGNLDKLQLENKLENLSSKINDTYNYFTETGKKMLEHEEFEAAESFQRRAKIIEKYVNK
ncbi:serine/threonine protein kinase [Dysgonomonadaceae bacterium PH5-43]|nr:serine/threonine protein kinase [Dysgonomonadaceae bacterium PH5-43]